MSATGAEVTVTTPVQQLVSTPNRFGRTSQGTYWNSGNGSPDAVCFCVDRPGIVIAGVGLYGGGGSYECDIELLDDMEQGGDAQPNGRWNTLEMVKAFYGPDDCVSDIAEIKFDRPVPIKENVKYAVRLRNRGQRTRNGDAGMVKVKCADGTVFTFSSCSLSSNGTNQSRGQIPTLLYYSSTQDGETTVENTRALAEQQARKNTITVVGAIFRAATELLQRAQTSSDEKVLSAIQNAAMFSTLLPMISAYIGPVAVVDPWGAVHVLRLVQDILPPVTSLSIRQNGDGSSGTSGTVDPTRHYAIVESDHPYKPASVSNYRASFPASVCWMSVEFDRRCGTAQSEDCLQLYIPTRPAGSGTAGSGIPPRGTGASTPVTISRTPVDGNTNLSDSVSGWWPVLTKFTGSDGWPTSAVILPGNEVCFSLETASDYVKDEKASFYGFRCTVIGYEWPSAGDQGLSHLEQEIAGLGGMCAAALMKKDIVLPPADDGDDDFAALEAVVKTEFTNHSALLSKGFSLLHAPTVTEALEGNLPLSGASCERAFLTDFIDCITGTSGGRLAAWLQPESYLDPRQCTVVHSSDGDLHCSVPVTITVLTRDQYARPVYVQNLKVEAAAVPVVKDLTEERRAKRLSRYDASDGSVIFGGHPPPKLDVPYHVTVKDSRDSYHAICIMKAYENYSFEELRYASPAVRRPTENMLIRDNQDGTYSATWTPGGVGFYHVQVKLDGCDAGEPIRMEVKDAPQGVTPPPMHHPPCRPSSGQHSRLRRFVATQSAGLRVRLHPSLQSEQIGIIRPGGIVSFVSEAHNEDGVWLRLSCDSIREFCSPLNGYTEGWALQYNQQLGKTLLVPVDEPRPDDHVSRDSNSRQPPATGAAAFQQVSAHNGFPCVYTTVKCGASGHNVRVAADLDSTAIGMVVVGNQLTAVDETATSEGMWIQLDPTSIQSYCHDTNGDAWCLARTTSGDIFLRPQTEIDLLGVDDNVLAPLASTCRPSPFAAVNGGTAIAVADGKGFDFTKASKTPTFSPFASTNLPEFFGATSGGPFAVVTDGRSAGSEVGTIVAAGQSTWFRAPTVHRGLSSRVSIADPLGKARSASLRREASPYGGSPRSAAAGAAGPGSREAGGGILIGGDGPQQKIQLQFPDLPPELQGVSVKELVKALGESRVNGNGVTPPRTPPGTPKKVASRSSSPRAPLPATVDAAGAAASSRGPSPKRDGSPSGPQGSVPPLAPSAVPAGSAPRVTSEPMSIAKNWLSPFRGIFVSSDDANSAGNKSATKLGVQQRSASSSPQRGADLSCVVSSCMPAPRASSSSPVRVSASAVSSAPAAAAAAAAAGPFVTMATARGEKFVPASTSKESSANKVSRKDRSRRSKRDRAASPGKSPSHGRTAHRSDSSESSAARDATTASTRILAPTTTPNEALSPSVALSMRAVFAAFLWHEGIVHDAMACASFLKFHPSLPKDAPASGHKKPAEVAAGGTVATAEEHSKEVPNINEAVRKTDGVGHTERTLKERHISESHATAAGNITASPLAADSEQLHGSTPSTSEDLSGLPPTLRHLVAFWEELTRTTQNVISLNLLAPSPQLATGTIPLESHGKSSEKGKDDKSKSGAAKKPKDGKVPAALPIMLRGNLFGSAAGRLFAGLGGPVDGDKDVRCELCNDTFAHPVTYHMRQAHPGCGKPAGGQGYNSGGNFCGGWAGNCGDGGIGGSTWYLMCDVCRTKYLRDRKKGGGGAGGKDRAKKSVGLSGLMRKRSSASSASLASCEPHVVMRDNALFVLDLAGGAGGSHVVHAGGATIGWDMSTSGSGTLSTVSEDGGVGTADGTVSFVPTPFLYLQLCGASGDDTAFADENSESFYRSQHNSGSGALWFDRSVSENDRHNRSRPLSTYLSFGNDTDEDQPLVVAGHASGAAKGVFQRSVSEMGGIGNSAAVAAQNGEENASSSRRRNNSVSDNGLSLLKRPSANMERLIRLTEHDTSADGADRILRQPVVSFVMQRHDLDSLRHVAAHAVRRAACRTYALQALNWLMRSVAHSACLHELLWHFVSALSGPTEDDGRIEVLPPAQDSEQDVAVCSHPLSDVGFAGDATTKPLVSAFHAFLQTVSDVMMHLPAGSALQRMAVRCWSLRFRPTDHVFLHRCHVFSHISRILSRSNCVVDGRVLASPAGGKIRVDSLVDVTAQTDMRASSRQAMVGGMTDGSTETFWESGDEDKNKTKTISVTCSFGSADCRLRVVCLHIDNARDIANKVSSVSMFAGPTTENQRLLRNVDLDQRHAGWVCAWVADSQARFVRLELKGPDNSLRVRQIKLLGEALGANDGPSTCDSVEVQRRECETETLSVFRLLTSLVFGRLVSEPANAASAEPDEASQPEPSLNGDVDLKEHMVGILFSHTGELTKLQRQVCAHIVGSIRRETVRVRAAWNASIVSSASESSGASPTPQTISDSYCFELLSLVLALSGSSVGRRYIAQQYGLVEDLVSLLHAASPRVQRQVVALLRRILSDVTPRSFATLLGVTALPPSDLGELLRSPGGSTSPPDRRSVLDVFLACIAKALSVQVKSKLLGVKVAPSAAVSLSESLHGSAADSWYMNGSISTQLAETIIRLIKDMSDGRLGAEWAGVTKAAVAAPIIALTRLAPEYRNPDTCMHSATMWLALAALCVLSTDHVERLSTGRWSAAPITAGHGQHFETGQVTSGQEGVGSPSSSPTCENHDDGETPATILCSSGCGSLCTECDRILHLSKKTRLHQRQVFKEEEESIRVDLHEGCGRVKLYWLLALADSKTLKSVVELRQLVDCSGTATSAAAAVVNNHETCRFCGAPATPDVLLPGAVCNQTECQEHAQHACTQVLTCGHACGGIRDEEPCLPCLHGCSNVKSSSSVSGLRQDADDMCMICFADALSAAPVILLECGHAFHAHCCRAMLERRWPGPRITFAFMMCPLCKCDMNHRTLDVLAAPARALRDDVRRKALMRLEYEGVMQQDGAGTESPAKRQDQAAFAMQRYAYYVCHKCKKAYYGGEARCEQQAGVAAAAATEEYDPSELVCGACSDVARAQMCARHGADFLEYKCRYCCSVAVYFCFGTTHFCGACHDDFQRVTAMSKTDLPHCPAGPRAVQMTGEECPLHVKHPATGEEFALGCGICRNAHTF